MPLVVACLLVSCALSDRTAGADDRDDDTRWSRTFDQPIAGVWPFPEHVRSPSRFVVALLDGRVRIVEGVRGELVGDEIRALPGVAALPGSGEGLVILQDVLTLIAVDLPSAKVRWRVELQPPGTRDIDPEWRLRYVSAASFPRGVVTLDSAGHIELRRRETGEWIEAHNRPASRYGRLLAPIQETAASRAEALPCWHLARRAGGGELLPLFVEDAVAPSRLIALREWPLQIAVDGRGWVVCLTSDRVSFYDPRSETGDRELLLETPLPRAAWAAPPILVGERAWLFAIGDDAQLRAYATSRGAVECVWAMPVEPADDTRLQPGFASDILLVGGDRFQRISLTGEILEAGPAADLDARRARFFGYRAQGATLYALR
ncbi:MAG: hypothetical protein SF069_14280 [Phycisphaerae bacterium]|nr:hypothetical protein [Phycisphaerae bacterium]